MSSVASEPAAGQTDSKTLWKVIGASSAGTLIEWYDFYIFGSLATIISAQFFPKGNETVALLSTLATFATGFIVRPFGALVFGRMGDLVGRKVTFLLTLVLMGLSTFAIGLLPTYSQIGVAAPILLLLMRLLQGLALGGEYGGAATYVAEYSPTHKRGFYTSFIQTTATLGLFVSLGVILAVRLSMPADQFDAWGWRVPFILSIVLIALSYYIRRRMQESPLFAAAKAKGKTSTNPIRDSFANPENRRLVILALLGATAGQGVVWYTGQFYALYYLQTVLNVEFTSSNLIIAGALFLATPFFVVFGALSDKIGRKKIILTGCLAAIVAWIPIYTAMQSLGDTTQWKPAGEVSRTESLNAKEGTSTLTQVTNYENGARKTEEFTAKTTDAKLPEKATKTTVLLPDLNKFFLTMLIFIQVLFVTMVYGPIAAYLVELFPTKIRYTSMSLPYHIGNGVFGGLVPLIGTWAVASSGSKLAGLWYPMAIAAMTLVVGYLYLPDRRNVDLAD